MTNRDDAKDEVEGQEPKEPREPEAEAEPTAEGEVELLTRIAELEGQVQELEDARLRLLAELDNTRKRASRDVEEAGKYAMTRFARDLLEVVDNLGRAREAVPEDEIERSEAIRSLVEGVAMTERALLSVLERHQIRRVEPEPGERFDHNRHQAMFEAESAEHPPGTITTVMQSGFTIADRLLRPALVGVAKAPPEPKPGDGADEAEPAGQGEPRPGSRIDTTA